MFAREVAYAKPGNGRGASSLCVRGMMIITDDNQRREEETSLPRYCHDIAVDSGCGVVGKK